jgi:hypothetical protein
MNKIFLHGIIISTLLATFTISQTNNSHDGKSLNIKKAIITKDSTLLKGNAQILKEHLNFKKFNVDSLIKKFNYEIELEKYFDDDFIKKLREYFERLPKQDWKRLEEYFKELELKFEKDSLKKKFKFFRKPLLLDESEIIEI